MTDQTSTLSVRALMDTSGYEAGVRKMAEGNKAAAASAEQVANALGAVGAAGGTVDGKLTPVSAGVEKLKRQFVEGYSATAAMEKAVRSLGIALDTGKIKAEEASAVLTGVIAKYGAVADVAGVTASLQARGQMQFAAQIDATTRKIQEQSMIVHAVNQNVIASDRHAVDTMAQYRRQNLTFQGVDIATSLAGGMPLGMIAAQQGGQILQGYIGQGGIKGLLSDIGGMAGTAARALGPIGLALGAAGAAAGAYYLLTRDGADKANENLSNHVELIKAAASAWGASLPALQAYVDQLDRAAKLKAAQEGTQALVDQSFAGLPDKMSSLTANFTQASRSLDQTDISADKFRELSSAFANLRKDVADNSVSMSDLDRVQRALSDAIATDSTPELAKFRDAWNQVTFAIRQASEEAAKAKADFLKAISGGTNVQDIIENNRVSVGDRTYSADAFTPKNPPIPTFRPPHELEGDDTEAKTQSAYDQVIASAKQRIAQVQTEIAIGGQAADVQARLNLEYEMQAQYLEKIASIKGATVNPAEVAAIKAKADELAKLNQQLAGQKFDQGQADNLDALRLQASLIGATTEQQARANAVYAANLAMRQQGLSLFGREADARRQAAADQASYRTEIERQQAAYQSLQQAQGQLIDDLTTGTGTMKDRLRAMGSDLLSWFQQIAVANPLKNAMVGVAFTITFEECAA